MHKLSDTPASQVSGINKTSTAKKLIQAAALASLLVPLGTVAVETATITCVTSVGNSGGFCGGSGVYSPTSGSNTWKFYSDPTYTSLIYWVDLIGNATSDFSLRLRDVVKTQAELIADGELVNFPTATCIPTFAAGECGLFDVSSQFGTPTWDANGYRFTINWYTNSDPLSQPSLDDLTYILQAKTAGGGTIFTNQLLDTAYDPAPTPTDPALGGRGDSFSRFGAFVTPTPVPEPGTMLLVGTGVVTALYRRRRKQQH